LQASTQIFGAVAAPLGNIDKVVVIEQGNSQSQTGVSRFASNAPTVIFNLLQQLEALGLNLPQVLSQLGVKTEGPSTTAIEKSPEGD